MNCIKTPGDGHCLVHAVLTSTHYIGLNRVPTKDTLLNLAYYEVINHLEYYGSFVNYKDSDLVQELEDYIRFKKFSSSTIDLVITAIGNALSCKILLLQEKETGYQLECNDHVILPMRDPQKPQCTIRFLWSGEHYDSLVEQGMLFYN